MPLAKDGKKICSHPECTAKGEPQDVSEFSTDKRLSDGLDSRCKTCNAKQRAARYATNPEKERARTAAYRAANQEKERARYVAYRAANLAAALNRDARNRATDGGLPFEDLTGHIASLLPSGCPICGCEFKVGAGKLCSTSASVDKYDPTIGYLVSNTWLLCMVCNKRKQDLTGEAMIALGQRLISKFSEVQGVSR